MALYEFRDSESLFILLVYTSTIQKIHKQLINTKQNCNFSIFSIKSVLFGLLISFHLKKQKKTKKKTSERIVGGRRMVDANPFPPA